MNHQGSCEICSLFSLSKEKICYIYTMKHVFQVEINKILASMNLTSSEVYAATKVYDSPSRSYHDSWHIKEMLFYVEPYRDQFSPNDFHSLQAAIIFHDCVYDPFSKTNEEDSVNVFVNIVDKLESNKSIWQSRVELVSELIMATKHHDYSDSLPELHKLIIKADLDRFNEDFENVWGYTKQLMHEYRQVDWKDFKKGRIEFLHSYAEKLREILGDKAAQNCWRVADALQVYEPRVALYPGSFHPFHTGHMNILRKAMKMFDKVIVGFANNPGKDLTSRVIPQSVRDMCQVEVIDGLLTDFMKARPYDITLIKGLRNTTDLSEGIAQLRFLQDFDPMIQVCHIICDKDFDHISSSAIKHLKKFSGGGPGRYIVE
jgi:pantetheine-phosphate adenylyltransferase